MNKSEHAKLLKLWKSKVRERAGNQCELFGCRNTHRTAQLHPHHLEGRRTMSCRYLLGNGVLLCASHHTMGLDSAHNSPIWFEEKMLNVRPGKDRELLRQIREFNCKYMTYAQHLGLMELPLSKVLEWYQGREACHLNTE